MFKMNIKKCGTLVLCQIHETRKYYSDLGDKVQRVSYFCKGIPTPLRDDEFLRLGKLIFKYEMLNHEQVQVKDTPLFSNPTIYEELSTKDTSNVYQLNEIQKKEVDGSKYLNTIPEDKTIVTGCREGSFPTPIPYIYMWYAPIRPNQNWLKSFYFRAEIRGTERDEYFNKPIYTIPIRNFELSDWGMLSAAFYLDLEIKTRYLPQKCYFKKSDFEFICENGVSKWMKTFDFKGFNYPFEKNVNEVLNRPEYIYTCRGITYNKIKLFLSAEVKKDQRIWEPIKYNKEW